MSATLVAQSAILLISIALLVWGVAILWHYFATGNLRFRSFKFSIRNYYILFLPIVISVVFWMFVVNSPRLLTAIIVFAITGVILEILIGTWWHVFFGQRLWIYRIETIDHAYSSLLNFIPWALGGFIFFSVIKYFYPMLERNSVLFSTGTFYAIFALMFLLGLFLQLAFFYLIFRRNNKGYKFHEVTWQNYLFFCIPIIFPVFVLTLLYGLVVILLTIVLGVAAALLEYLFGKVTEFFISKKLWVYTYAAVDSGHFTPLSMPLFTLGGFYFGAVATLFLGL